MVERLERELRRLALLPDYNVEAFVRTDGRSLVWNVRDEQQQLLQPGVRDGKPLLQFAGASPSLFRYATELGLFFRCCILELGTYRIAFRAQLIDIRLESADFAVERKDLPQVEADVLDLDRAFYGVAVRLDEVDAQHGAPVR